MTSLLRSPKIALLTIVASLAAAAESEPPLANERTIENLATFARVYGYVRFFHPSDEAASVDWDAMAILGAEVAGNAKDTAALQAALRELFGPLTCGLKFPVRNEIPRLAVLSFDPGQRVTYWQHNGIRLSEQSNIYRSRREKLVVPNTGLPADSGTVPSPATLVQEVAPGIHLSLPLLLPVSAEGKTTSEDPAGFSALRERLDALAVKSLTPADWRLRVGGVVTAWNIFQHFHPYLERIGINWEDTLRPALRRALADRTRLEYHATLSELVAKLHDGHGYVFGRDVEMGGIPIRVEVIQQQIVVTGAAAGSPFQKGDILQSIDGVGAMEVLRERERYVSGSPQLRRHRALNQFGEGALNSSVQIELLRDGEPVKLDYVRGLDRRGFFFNSIPEFELPTFAELKPGIFYVNLQSIPLATLKSKLPDLASAKGVIFDYRWDGRPSTLAQNERVAVHRDIIPHLTTETVHASPMLVPKALSPNRQGWTYDESTWPVEPKAPRFGGRAVFINVPAVVSYGETCMAMIAHHKLATLVGEPTAGCNGNVNHIPLPAGFRIMWTGMEVLKLDRSLLYGPGFVPDYPVTRTLAAVKNGRDEFLQEAISVVETDRASSGREIDYETVTR